MNPLDFLNVADSLIEEPGQASWRSAVSRAYYAAFHVARDLLAACGFAVPRTERAHGYLYHRLHNCGQPDLTRAASVLNLSRDARNVADYDLHLSFEHPQAVGQLRAAMEIVDRFRSALGNPAVLARIAPVMRDYERDILKEVTWRP